MKSSHLFYLLNIRFRGLSRHIIINMIKPQFIFFEAVALMLAIAVALLFVPNSKLSNREYKEIKHYVSVINNELPEITPLGQIDKVEFKEGSLVWYISIYGDESIREFYFSMADLLRRITKDYNLICYYDKKFGYSYRKMLDKDIGFRYIITLPDETKIDDVYKAAELKQYAENSNLTPAQALAEILSIFISFKIDESVESIISIALSSLCPPSEATPLNAWVEGGNIIVWWYAENQSYLDFWEQIANNSESLEQLKMGIYEIRQSNGYVDMLCDMVEEAQSNLIFRFSYNKNCPNIDLPIPIVNKWELETRERLKEFNRFLFNK